MRVLVARLFLLFKKLLRLYPNEKAMPFEANLRVHDRATRAVQARANQCAYPRRPLSGVKVKSLST
jgi:hypothetical protein